MNRRKVQSTAEALVKRGRPSALDQQRLEKRILEAAFECFKGGLHEASFQKIADTAGTTRRSITDRYPKKEDLLVAVISDKSNKFYSVVERSAECAGQYVQDKLKETCRMIFREVSKPDFVAFYQICTYGSAQSKRIAQTFMFLSDRFEELLCKLATDEHHQPSPDGAQRKAMAMALIGVFISYPVYRATIATCGGGKFENNDTMFELLWNMVNIPDATLLPEAAKITAGTSGRIPLD